MRKSSTWKRRLIAGLAIGIAAVFLVAGGATVSPDDTTWLGGAHTNVPVSHIR
jgi:hypothetical protein